MRFPRLSPTLVFTGLALLTAPAGSPLTAQAEHRDSRQGELGEVEFNVSCDPGVREDFDRATALLHHMMYREARSAYQDIAHRDPECPMAPWGVAMTLFQPLWPARPDAETRRRGWSLVQEARDLGPETGRERSLVQAAAAFFRDPGTDEWWPRIQRWRDAMAEAHGMHPDAPEIAALHGLSILAAGQVADDQVAENARAAEILDEVRRDQPLHPGAIHYTIHADDATGRADEHLDVVARYSEIAPEVPHALHMPSHIYVRLGRWDQVIDWNRRSARAALERSTGERVSLHHLHALDYLLYAYLQQGDDAAARNVLGDDLADRPYQEGFITAFHLAVMPARLALERRDWAEAAQIEPGEPDYLAWSRYEWPRALSWFAAGLGAAQIGEMDRAREAERRMTDLRRSAREAGEEDFATNIEKDRLILSGWIAHREGDARTALERMRQAAALGRTVEKNPVTPGSLLPPHEALGDLLTALDLPGEALAAYEASLEIWPRRYRSLLGAARAAADAGEEEAAEAHYRTLLEIAAEVEHPRPGVEEAREALGGRG